MSSSDVLTYKPKLRNEYKKDINESLVNGAKKFVDRYRIANKEKCHFDFFEERAKVTAGNKIQNKSVSKGKYKSKTKSINKRKSLDIKLPLKLKITEESNDEEYDKAKDELHEQLHNFLHN